MFVYTSYLRTSCCDQRLLSHNVQKSTLFINSFGFDKEPIKMSTTAASVLNLQIAEERLIRYEEEGCLHEMFSRQAKLTPNAVAVLTDDGTSLTFEELDGQTDKLAAHLQANGVVPDSCVGIYMERCVEYVVSYIAILKAGGAYMPLDITYPQSLLTNVFADAEPACVLTNQTWQSGIKDMGQNVFIFKDNWQSEITNQLQPVNVTLDNLAYIVYSSGTTGKPKGIMCPHRGAVFSYTWRHLAYPFEEDDRVACNVFFTWEMLRSLLKGIPLYIIPDTVIYDPALLCEFVHRHKITRMLLTPSLLQTVIDSNNVKLQLLRSMRIIWFCGEVVTTTLLERCSRELPWIRFLNLYSISECHDVATEDLTEYWKEMSTSGDKIRRKFSPVGKVIPGGVNVVILDENNNPLPVGVPGEIYVGGPTLARGYLNRPDLNKSRFIDRPPTVDPSVGERLYRAGDWGLIVGNRVLEICGRCDSMVKIRGYSIETQAVESALLELSIVAACVVLAVGEEGEDKQLIAYVVPSENVTKKQIRSELKRKLPFYMIPSQFVFLKSIPVLPASGKLNKKALPPVKGRRPTLEKIEILEKMREPKPDENIVEEEESDLPKTETENILADIWSEILNFNVDDVTESFFDLGGHSLLAAALVAKVKEKFHVELSVKALFDNSTINQLAQYIESLQKGENLSLDGSEVDFEKEVERNTVKGENLDIQLRSFWRSVGYGDRWNRGKVLITGVTGFLGAYLLKELLLQTECFIYCIVRPHPKKSAEQRIAETVEFYQLFDKKDQEFEKVFDARVHALTGDVALANLGLSDEDYEHLCFEVDTIIHAAAHVNLIYPYKALKGTNVYGTRNVLHLARTGKIKPIHHVSTNSVFPNNMENCMEEPTPQVYSCKLDDGYSQSKWVAENLVLNASELGLPTTIYRIGNISGDCSTGCWNPSDFTLLVLRASAATGCWPDVEWMIEMTPVDFVSSAIINGCKLPPAENQQIFHVINQPKTSQWLLEQMKSFGYKLEVCSFDDWCDKVSQLGVEKCPSGHLPVKKMLDSVITTRDRSLFEYNTTFNRANLEKRLLGNDKTYPEVSNDLIGNYLRKLNIRSVLAKPNRRLQDNVGVDGKVVLVTGASSGIGEAVATHFANAGAKVALCARREQKLKEIQDKLKSQGKHCVYYKLDVTDREQFKSTVAAVENDLGPVDVLVNNAGVMYYTHMTNLMEEDWERTIDINCKGVTNGVGAVLKGMVERKRGHIINMSSDAGRRGFAGLAVYSGTKFYVEGFSQGLRHEVREHGIRVTTIQPGNVATELASHTPDADALKEFGDSTGHKVLCPDDIARAVLYAASQPDYVAANEILIEPRDEPI